MSKWLHWHKRKGARRGRIERLMLVLPKLSLSLRQCLINHDLIDLLCVKWSISASCKLSLQRENTGVFAFQPGDLHSCLQGVVSKQIDIYTFLRLERRCMWQWALFSWCRPFLAEAYLPLFSRQKQKTKSLLCLSLCGFLCRCRF